MGRGGEGSPGREGGEAKGDGGRSDLCPSTTAVKRQSHTVPLLRAFSSTVQQTRALTKKIASLTHGRPLFRDEDSRRSESYDPWQSQWSESIPASLFAPALSFLLWAEKGTSSLSSSTDQWSLGKLSGQDFHDRVDDALTRLSPPFEQTPERSSVSPVRPFSLSAPPSKPDLMRLLSTDRQLAGVRVLKLDGRGKMGKGVRMDSGGYRSVLPYSSPPSPYAMDKFSSSFLFLGRTWKTEDAASSRGRAARLGSTRRTPPHLLPYILRNKPLLVRFPKRHELPTPPAFCSTSTILTISRFFLRPSRRRCEGS